MVDALAVRDILSVEGAAWTGTLVLALFVLRMWNGAPAMFEQWISYRRAKAEEKAADWSRLRDHCNFLIEAEERCRAELGDVERRLAKLEGYAEGQGNARQEAAGIVAIERLGQDKSKPREGGK